MWLGLRELGASCVIVGTSARDPKLARWIAAIDAREGRVTSTDG
jgi:hypothetical protein